MEGTRGSRLCPELPVSDLELCDAVLATLGVPTEAAADDDAGVTEVDAEAGAGVHEFDVSLSPTLVLSAAASLGTSWRSELSFLFTSGWSEEHAAESLPAGEELTQEVSPLPGALPGGLLPTPAPPVVPVTGATVNVVKEEGNAGNVNNILIADVTSGL